MNTETFTAEINRQMVEAETRGARSVTITSGQTHRQVGGYPGTNHRMKTCCDVMEKMMLPGDRIVDKPRKGKGASLTIEYMLPRHH